MIFVQKWKYFKASAYGPHWKASTQQSGTYFMVTVLMCTMVSIMKTTEMQPTKQSLLQCTVYTYKTWTCACHEGTQEQKSVTPLTLNLGTDGGMWSATCPGYYTPKGNTTSYPLNRRLGAPGAVKSLTWNAFSFCTFKHRTCYIMLVQNFMIKLQNILLTLVWKECLHCKEVWSLVMVSIQIIHSSSELSFDFDQLVAESCTPPHALPNLSIPIEPILTKRLKTMITLNT